MKNVFIAAFCLIFIQTAQAEDQWSCVTDPGSVTMADVSTLKACGEGKGANEQSAREDAMRDAKMVYFRFCFASDNCRGYQVSLEPGRTTCGIPPGTRADNSYGPVWNKYRCHTMITYLINREADRICGPGTHHECSHIGPNMSSNW